MVRLAQLRSPGETLRHVVEHCRELRERFHALIPGLFVYGLRQGATLQVFVLLQPIVRNRNLIRERRSSKYLADQVVGIESDWSN